jgi:hypothetical protein
MNSSGTVYWQIKIDVDGAFFDDLFYFKNYIRRSQTHNPEMRKKGDIFFLLFHLQSIIQFTVVKRFCISEYELVDSKELLDDRNEQKVGNRNLFLLYKKK